MHYEPTGRASEVVEVYDNKVCRGCRGLLTLPHARIASQPCSCAEHGYHRILICKDCGTEHWEPECTNPNRGTGSHYG